MPLARVVGTAGTTGTPPSRAGLLLASWSRVAEKSAIRGNKPLRVSAPRERLFHNVLLREAPDGTLWSESTGDWGPTQGVFPFRGRPGCGPSVPASLAAREGGSPPLWVDMQADAALPQLDAARLTSVCEDEYLTRSWSR
ncbi:hypothetical protein LRP88_13799 [Fusarium phalaenopsidis]